jgi:hypothetical protein
VQACQREINSVVTWQEGEGTNRCRVDRLVVAKELKNPSEKVSKYGAAFFATFFESCTF